MLHIKTILWTKFRLKKDLNRLKIEDGAIPKNGSQLYYFNPKWSNALLRFLRLIKTSLRLNFVYRIA